MEGLDDMGRRIIRRRKVRRAPKRMPASSGGFGQRYPLALTSGQPRPTYLRPLQQPLYDTEVMPNAGGGRPNLNFFQRALSATFAYTVGVKSKADTNLTQPGQIPQPQNFWITGFTIEVQSGITFADFGLIYNQSVMTFIFSGNRIFLEIPLSQIPQGIAPAGFASLDPAAVAPVVSVANGIGSGSNVYRMTIGRNALQIMPSENFQITIQWPNGNPAVSADVRVRAFIRGLLFNAI